MSGHEQGVAQIRYARRVRTLAALVFIAGVAAVAIALARMPTVADGRVLEAELLALTREQGVVGMQCDRKVPIGLRGAQFSCTALLGAGATQELACAIDRDARLSWKPVSGVRSRGGTSGHAAPGSPRDVGNAIIAPEDPQGGRP
jgi:hypothetical protein